MYLINEYVINTYEPICLILVEDNETGSVINYYYYYFVAVDLLSGATSEVREHNILSMILFM